MTGRVVRIDGGGGRLTLYVRDCDHGDTGAAVVWRPKGREPQIGDVACWVGCGPVMWRPADGESRLYTLERADNR